jgi:uncharacterized protein
MAPVRTWQRALVTGASSGIGAAFARELGKAGADLVIVARTVDKLEALADEVRDRSGVDVEVLGADLADPDALAGVEQRVAAVERPIDLLVNNAGYGFQGEFGEIPVDDEEAEIRVNIIALVRLSHAAAQRMPTTGGGGILNVSSVASFQPSPHGANYGATKAYVTSLSQALHEELRPKGVTVTALCPGLTRTEFQDRGGYRIGLPEFAWQQADEVARAGLAAVARGDAIEVPGLHNKALVSTVRVLPMTVQRRLAAEVTKRFG